MTLIVICVQTVWTLIQVTLTKTDLFLMVEGQRVICIAKSICGAIKSICI
jgi:hypothetical protein